MTRDDLPDDELMTRLGAVLRDEAGRYEPAPDSLGRIQARVPARGRRVSVRWLAPLAAAAVVVGVASAVVLQPGADHTATPLPGTSSGMPRPTGSPAPLPTVSTPSESPSATPQPSGSATGGPGPTPSKTGPVKTGCISAGKHGYAYYVSDLNGTGPRLYRGTALLSCHLGVEEALTVPVGKDPDYLSMWPSGTKVLSMSRAGAVVTVDLSAFPVTSQQNETAAVQQLVWTVTANDPSITSVRVKVDGAPPVAHLDWSKPVRRGNSLATLSNVWIISPGNASTNGSPLKVRIYGTGFEGQVPLRIYQDGTEVASGAVTTRMGGFAEATTTFDLPPGTYELRAYNDNGQNGDLELWDTKTFTIA